LWLLSRQLTVGELDGDSGGTPVEVRVRGEATLLTHYQPAGGSPQPYDPTMLPLDALVEPEPVRTVQGWTARRRIDAGRELFRCLREHRADASMAAFRTAFPLAAADAALREIDPRGAALLDVAVGRMPDGEKLFGALVPDLRAGRQPKVAGVPASQAVLNAELAWLTWLDATLTEPAVGADAWNARRMEHDFSVEAQAPAATLRLAARGYRGGGLEWYTFDAEDAGPGQPSAAVPQPIDLTVLPTPVRFRGMPAARWWEMEDSQIDLGAVDAAPSDLARLALLEFALVYGNDFFAVPVRLPVGALVRLDALVCTDSFGARILIRPTTTAASRQAGERWTMFTLSAPQGGVADTLFLAPGAGERLEGPPLEEVHVLRDEMANLVWPIEHAVAGAAGGALRRAEESARLAPDPGPPPPAGARLHYILGTSVPRHWFPLVPVDEGGALALEVRRMGDGGPEPQGRLLPPLGRRLDEREVPREGLRMIRRAAAMRWIGSTSTAFIRRERRVGRGEGSSGLRFDVVEPKPSPASE
jgi:hypothetical protein